MKTLKNTKKITLATLKAFAKRNEGKIYRNNKLKYNTETGEVETVATSEGWVKAHITEKSHYYKAGIFSIYTLGNGKDSFKRYEDAEYEGIEVSNSCGVTILAVKKQADTKKKDPQIELKVGMRFAPSGDFSEGWGTFKIVKISGETVVIKYENGDEVGMTRKTIEARASYGYSIVEENHPHDLIEKGKKYDRVKEQRDELLNWVKILIDRFGDNTFTSQSLRMLMKKDLEKVVKSAE